MNETPKEASDTPDRSSGAAKLAVGIATAILAAAGIAFFASDGRELLRAAGDISWVRILVPVIATILSYATMAASYEGIAKAASTPIGFSAMHRITYVSNTINYMVSTGGLSGFAVRMYFFRKNGIPLGRAVTISFVQGLITNLTLLVFLIFAFIFLLTHESLSSAAIASAAVALLVFTSITLLLVGLFLHAPTRRKSIRSVIGAVHVVTARLLGPNRAPTKISLLRLAKNIDDGLAFMQKNGRAMITPILFIIADWFLTLAVLWGCFYAVGLNVPFALISVGFAIGILSTLVSITPAGIGIMESAVTTIFVALGQPLEPTIIAVILFRLIFYALPFGMSIGFFHGMFQDAREHTQLS